MARKKFSPEYIISSQGGEVQVAENGEVAIQKANQGHFDVILMEPSTRITLVNRSPQIS